MTSPIEADLPHAPRGMIDGGLTGFRGRRVLMLQGPIGPFFTRLAVDLAVAGAKAFKINFNGGDRLFGRSPAFRTVLDYRGTMPDWPATFEAFVVEHAIDTILLFGDCRPVHVPAIAIAKARGIEIGVFEEGYLRPDFITIERDGVNKHSTLPKDPAFYRKVGLAPVLPTAPLGSTFGRAALWGCLYYCAASLGYWRFRHHQHHRPLGWRESRFWARSLWRKLKYRLCERAFEQRFVGPEPVRFFLVALQTSGDAQVRIHSRFQTVERFIEYVIRDFAAHAPSDVELAIKHHPLDRGFSDHRGLIDRLAAELGLIDRCHYLHDQHLPTLLRKTMGVVTINSTVGLSAVGEGVPVIACGESIYDIEGLVFKGPLARFWTEASAHPPDFLLWQAFRNVLVTTTQFNGSFYKRHAGAGFDSGVFWDKRVPTMADVERLPDGPSLRPRFLSGPSALHRVQPGLAATEPSRSRPKAYPFLGVETTTTSRPLSWGQLMLRGFPARRLAADREHRPGLSGISVAAPGAQCTGNTEGTDPARDAAEAVSGWGLPLICQEQAFENSERALSDEGAEIQEGDALEPERLPRRYGEPEG